MSKPAFEVDKQGLAKLLERRGKSFAVLELIQNAFDENVTTVSAVLSPTPNSHGYHTLIVEDDCPEGFANLAHAYTLFAESGKKANPEKRGRFNLGEKLVLAVCRRASIQTTKGTIEWEGDQRSHRRAKTDKGTVFTGELRMTKAEALDALAAARTVIVPANLQLSVNGENVPRRSGISSFVESLPTETADDDGYLRRTSRRTRVTIYEPLAGETSMLYELGIPVVDIDCPWHADVEQKVPLNTDRDNVTPAYLRRLLALVLNTMHEQAPQEALRAPWTGEALASDLLDAEAVDAVITARYGKKRVAYDPSDPEANKLAVSKGYTVIHGGAHSALQWDNIRAAGSALPAGQVTPSPKPWSDDPDAPDAEKIPEEKWTKGMRRIAVFSEELGRLLLEGGGVDVSFVNVPNAFDACFGSRQLTFNIRKLGKKWFDQDPMSVAVLALLIHEFGHHRVADHLSSEYHDELCRLGARLTQLALSKPVLFEEE